MTTLTEIEEFSERVLCAFKTLRALPDPDARFFQYRSLWPDTTQSTEEAYGYDLARMPRFRPSPADVSDCLPILALMRGIPRREWRLIWWRSLGFSFRGIAMRIGRSDETARCRYWDVIRKVWGNYQNVTWQIAANQGIQRYHREIAIFKCPGGGAPRVLPP